MWLRLGDSIKPAILEAQALGFIRVTRWGRAGNGEWRYPSLFALTHYGIDDNPKPTNDWEKIETMADAEAIAKAARLEEKQNAIPGKWSRPRSRIRSTNGKTPSLENGVLSASETGALSISREETPQAAQTTDTPWCVPIPNINPEDEADSLLWADAWLAEVPNKYHNWGSHLKAMPAPTVSLAELRAAMGYHGGCTTCRNNSEYQWKQLATTPI